MKLSCVAAVVACAGVAHADILLDHRPSAASGTGYTVGFNSFTVYQPFTVTNAAGWNLERIWLDGWRVTGSGDLKVEIADSDFGPALASTVISMTNVNATTSAFVSGDLAVSLAGNTPYVMRVAAVDPATTWTALYFGASGELSRSRDGSGNFYNNGTSISTYFEGTIVPGPAGLALFVAAGFAVPRRRR